MIAAHILRQDLADGTALCNYKCFDTSRGYVPVPPDVIVPLLKSYLDQAVIFTHKDEGPEDEAGDLEQYISYVSEHPDMDSIKLPYPIMVVEIDMAEFVNGTLIVSSRFDDGTLRLTDAFAATGRTEPLYLAFSYTYHKKSKRCLYHPFFTSVTDVNRNGMKIEPIAPLNEVTSQYIMDSMTQVGLIVALLYLHESEITEKVPVSDKINKKRRKKGRVELYEHRVLVIGLGAEKRYARTEGSNCTGGTKRLHLRRGHLRRYQNGRGVWIKPMWVGDAKKGVVTKDYILK